MNKRTVKDLLRAVDDIAPLHLAEEWDNVGLLVGRGDAPVSSALLTIDLTPAVLEEAVRQACEAVISYHPPIFKPLKRIANATPAERVVMRLLERGIAVISPHTALDAAPNGLNDWIAAGIGTGDVRALVPHGQLPPNEETKIVTFCPVDAVDRLRDALAAVGAGRIGGYERCSFEGRGFGTFFGGSATEPRVGKRGQLERVEEARLEMVCPRRVLALAVESIRQFHPYEEPPIEIHELSPRPFRHTGAGRRITLDQPLTIQQIAERLKSHFGVSPVQVALPDGAPEQHSRIGISAGAGGTHLDIAIESGCTLFVTGECRHHDVLASLARGCGLLIAGHTNTERGYLPTFARRLAQAVEGVTFQLAAADRDPFVCL
ncbi:MAG: Nif3-like dinuclear metal center hexameric protein [Phycisphaerae bacterium]|jgi:dinuclear metal center YbgI/SA1388 family protein|nr:Nif3-like dinuclear metal center hexameric protein [Phycisphaerae bacterium]